MRFKRTVATALAAAAATAGSAAAVGLPATAAHAAGTATSVTLPFPSFSHMVLDPAHQHIFISSAASNEILVTDYSGNAVATIANEPGADGLALSSDGSTVYAALSTGDAISAISTSTLAETTRYATGTGTDPSSVAYTSGKIWFGYGAYGTFGYGVGSVDPSTSPATVNLDATNDGPFTWYTAPLLAASPNGELVVGETNSDPFQLASYNVSSGTATVLTPPTLLDAPTYSAPFSNLHSLQITPDGADVVVASGDPYYQVIFQVSNLAEVGEYPTAAYPDAVSIASDGTVAAGAANVLNPGVYLFAPGGSTPLATYSFGTSADTELVDDDGVAITPDARELFVVADNSNGNNPTLNIITDPVQGPSTLTVTGPTTDYRDRPITLTGTLGGAAPYAGGQTLQVTRIDPAHPNGVALPDVTTAANGSFTITDTPPRAHVERATVTYKVSYAGDGHLTASSASVSVTVHYNNS